MPVTRFFDAETRPPRGNWHFFINGRRVEKYTEGDITDELRRFRKNNGTFESEEALQAELWAYWCAKEPARCGQAAAARDLEPLPGQPARKLSKEIWGPWIWNYLALEAVRFNKTAFLWICRRVVDLMQCPECQAEFRDILANDSPDMLANAQEACQWVLRQHNRVSQKLGKPQWSFAKFVAQYGAPGA